MRLRLTLFTFFLLFLGNIVFGQILKADISYGRVFKHSPKFLPTITQNSVLAELSYEHQTLGKDAWNARFGYPLFGVAVSYAQLGDADYFGKAVAVFPHLSFTTRARHQHWYTYLRGGMGLAYLTKSYNLATNPTNNVIGSHWNNITDIRGGFGFFLSQEAEVLAGASFTHYSSGATSQPNLGINVPAFSLGFRYSWQRRDSLLRTVYERDKKLYVQAHFSVGGTQIIAPSGPMYPIYIASLAIQRSFDKRNKHSLALGVEYEQNEGVRHWLQQNNHTPTEQTVGSRRYAIWLGDELFFGHFSFNYHLGYYLNLQQQKLGQWFLYQKIGWRWYFLTDAFAQPYVHIQLKAHRATAEYFSIGVGSRF